jgi:putative transposase
MTTEQKRRLIEPRHRRLSVSRQCALLGLPRSTCYYQSAGSDGYNERLMRLIDEQYTATPFYGVPRMTAGLRSQGHLINPKRVRRLMRLLGLEAIYPKRRTSMPAPAHKKFPYLLKGLTIKAPDQVWSTDITYVRLNRGFIYLMAIMDWFSRYVVCWEVSLTLESSFCVQALERALQAAQPQIFNSDQGSQFTSDEFTKRLEDRGIQISMDGRGRFYDNIFIERLWRTVKYEEVYLRDYESVPAAIESLACYFAFYNQERIHQSLDYQTPADVYFGQRRKPDRAHSHIPVSSRAMARELLAAPLLVGGTAGG